VWGDEAYQGQREAMRRAAPHAQDMTSRRTRYKQVVDELQRRKNRTKHSHWSSSTCTASGWPFWERSVCARRALKTRSPNGKQGSTTLNPASLTPNRLERFCKQSKMRLAQRFLSAMMPLQESGLPVCLKSAGTEFAGHSRSTHQISEDCGQVLNLRNCPQLTE
jgi:hypothetical protein